MLTVSDVQALIVITLGDAFVLNRRVRQHRTIFWGTVIANCLALSWLVLEAPLTLP